MARPLVAMQNLAPYKTPGSISCAMWRLKGRTKYTLNFKTQIINGILLSTTIEVLPVSRIDGN
jgi:hypothetical protein